MRIYKYFLCILVYASYSTFGSTSTNAQIKVLNPPTALAGFRLASSPNYSDSPGLIYQLDQAGIRHEFQRLNITQNLSVKQSPTTPKITLRVEMAVVDLQVFLTGDTEPALKAPADKITLEMSIENVERLELPANLDELLGKLKLVEDWKRPELYFLITEALRASGITYKLKKEDAVKLSEWLVKVSERHPNVSFDLKKNQIIQSFTTPQYVAYKIDELVEKSSSITGVPGRGTARIDAPDKMSWSAAILPSPWPPPTWSTRYELPTKIWRKSDATLGSVFDVIQDAFNRAGIRDRWVYLIGENGFVVIGRQESIDDEGNPLPYPQRWSDNPCSSLWNLLSCVVGSAKLNTRTTVFIFTDWQFSSRSGTSPEVFKQDSGRTSLTQQLRDKPVPPDAVGQALIYHFVKKNQNPPELVPQEMTIPGREHLIRSHFWKGAELP